MLFRAKVVVFSGLGELCITMSEREGLVRAATLAGFETMVRRYGVEPDQLFEMAGLSPVYLAEPELYMSFSRYVSLMEYSALETGNRLFGAELGLEQGLKVMGATAYGMSTSFTLREALGFLFENLTFQTTGNVIRLEVFDERAMLSSEIVVSTPHGAQQTMNHTVGLGIRMMKTFYGEAWKPIEIFFQHGVAPDEKRAYLALFGERVQFNSECSGFTFRSELLDTPLPDADPVAHKMFKRQLESLAATAPDDFVQRVESVIRVAIPKGEISLTSAAKSLALSTRSLQRKLQEQGTSFHEMVDTSRRQVAEHYISNSNLQLSQITELLGFTRLSNLTHAFKRWHGMSPSEWKKSQLELPR